MCLRKRLLVLLTLILISLGLFSCSFPGGGLMSSTGGIEKIESSGDISNSSDEAKISILQADNITVGLPYNIKVQASLPSSYENAFLYYRDAKREIFTKAPMEKSSSDGFYEGDIPPGAFKSGCVEYYISGVSPDSTRVKSKVQTIRVSGISSIHSKVACDGLYFYYTLGTDSNGNHGIYKIGIDGSNPAKICDDPTLDVFIKNNFIYYRNFNDGKIYRINSTDGTNKFKVSDEIVYDMKLYNDFIYYSCFNGFYRMNLEGSFNLRLNRDRALWITLYENKIYYSTLDNEPGMFSSGLNGDDRVRIAPTGSNMYVNDGFIYYMVDEGGLARVKTDGTLRLVYGNIPELGEFAINNGFIYSNILGVKMLKININDGTSTEFKDTKDVRWITSLNNEIYYLKLDSKSPCGVSLFKIINSQAKKLGTVN